ncbi:MAG: dihydrodipicolinate synthase family protein [Longimicrobiales bacterium]|nr:dihydrodipicolinate synthase family protein [Longimicrobiales bacterium]
MGGVEGILIPTTTPFDREGELDLDALRSNIEHFATTPVSGFLIGGSTGEAVLLDPDERVACLRVAREAASGRTLIAGTGAESLRATLALTRSAAEAGADAVLVQPPAFYTGAMNADALIEHYLAVADASPLPVLVYQVPPKFATLVFPDEVIARLAEHPRIVGLKDSRGEKEGLERWLDLTPAEFSVFVGNGALLFDALCAGAVGGILGVANLVPRACAELLIAFREGRLDDARALLEVIAPLHRGIVGGMGVPGVKAALDRLGLEGGPPRPPLRRLPESRHAELEALLSGIGEAHR